MTDFLYLADEPADQLATLAGAVSSDIQAIQYHFYSIGRALLQARPLLLKEGRFMAWVNFHFGAYFSYDTLTHYMDVCQKLPALMVENPQITARAKYILSSGQVPPERVAIGVTLAEAGRLDEESARIVRYAPDQIVQRFIDGNLPKDQTAAFTVALNKLPALYQEVKTACIGWGVSRAEMVEYLAGVYGEWLKTRHSDHPAGTWLAIKEDDGLLNGFGWSIPVGHPDAVGMIPRHKADRQYLHLSELEQKPGGAVWYDWSENRTGVITTDLEGRVCLTLDPESIRRVKTGESVIFRIRTKRK